MLKKIVLPTVAISGMIFAGFAIFLAQYGSERIEVEVDNQNFFYGEVRDIVSPRMGVALGLTLGVASIAVIGYSKSASQVELLEKQLLSIKKAISDKDAQIEELRNDQKINNMQLVNFGRR
ncbi:MAG: hypothetical protein WBA39_29880 [Rivularia sp. (in: cyanobacteria)]